MSGEIGQPAFTLHRELELTHAFRERYVQRADGAVTDDAVIWEDRTENFYSCKDVMSTFLEGRSER